MAIHTFGPNAVDWEQRVDLARLREERLARLKAQLERSELGALLSFDFANIRYMTATHIGTWAMDKLIRFALLPRGGEPVVWDFGSAARHHQLYNPWLDHTAGPATPEGAGRPGPGPASPRCAARSIPSAGIAEEVARKVAAELREHGLAGAPLGIDVAEMPVLAALRAGGHRDRRRPAGVPGGAPDQDPRRDLAAEPRPAPWSTPPTTSCTGSCGRACGRTSASGWSARCCMTWAASTWRASTRSPASAARRTRTCLSDRLIRPGDPAFFDILHSHLGYRTCYYRTFAVGSASRAQRDAYVRCREYMDASIALVRPGATTADIVSLWPRAQEFGFPDETAAFALQYGHGVGLSIWEKPIFSRLVSLDHPEPLEEGMVFALETYWPAADGWSAARIEEEVVVTADGCEVITKFPAEELLVAGRKYWTAGGALDTLRESQSHLNTAAGRGERAPGTPAGRAAPGEAP